MMVCSVDTQSNNNTISCVCTRDAALYKQKLSKQVGDVVPVRASRLTVLVAALGSTLLLLCALPSDEECYCCYSRQRERLREQTTDGESTPQSGSNSSSRDEGFQCTQQLQCAVRMLAAAASSSRARSE
jgi:hypothetical protein